MANPWYEIPEQTKINAYTQISERTGMSAFAVEKDWWVMQALAIIFEMEIGEYLVFKGGTSLSKAWNLIDRFSEDVDLAVDRDFLGFNGELTKKQVTSLRKDTSKYIEDKFYPELTKRFAAEGLDNVRIELIVTNESDQDPRIIEIYYPNVIESPGYLQPKVQIEIGCRSLREPFTLKTISSLISEHYPDEQFAQNPIRIPVVNPERTLLEKVFLLHEEFQRPNGMVRVNRLSRHLYDIYQLSKTEFAKKALSSPELYETIVKHRYRFTRLSGVNYNLHQPQSINPIPPADFIEAWEVDYKIMQEQMIYGDSPKFNDMIQVIHGFIAKLNGLAWKMESKFKIHIADIQNANAEGDIA